MKLPIMVEFAFDDWIKGGVSVYQTEKGVELSKKDFHSGTIFQGVIMLDEEHQQDLIAALKEGYTPTFTLFEASSLFEGSNEHS